MAVHKAASTKTQKSGSSGFPAEAGHFYDEVSEQQLDALRQENKAKFAGEEWEVIDGLEFPYEKCA